MYKVISPKRLGIHCRRSIGARLFERFYVSLNILNRLKAYSSEALSVSSVLFASAFDFLLAFFLVLAAALRLFSAS